MLLGMDEYPFHQVTQTFAAVAGSDPQWNDGHYVCVGDQDGKVALTSNVRLYQNNDVLDGFVCLRHDDRQYNIRVSRKLRPQMEVLGAGPLRLELIEPMRVVRLVLEDNGYGISLDLTCYSTSTPYMDPIEITRLDGRLMSERATYELAGVCEGWVSVGGERIELTRDRTSFFRNHSWGFQGGRGGPRLYGAPTASRRVPGTRLWVLYNMTDHNGFFFEDPNGRAAAGHGVIMLPDRNVPVAKVEHELVFGDDPSRVRSGTFQLTDADGVARSYEFENLGWVYCQGGGYFGGFDDRLGQGVYRGEYHEEGEVWDVSHGSRIVEATGREFEFAYAWAENFTRLRCGDDVGMAHFECVVIPRT